MNEKCCTQLNTRISWSSIHLCKSLFTICQSCR